MFHRIALLEWQTTKICRFESNWKGQKSILSGRASAVQQNPTLLILRKSKNNPLRKWWKTCSQSKKRALKILFGNKLQFCLFWFDLRSRGLSFKQQANQDFIIPYRNSVSNWISQLVLQGNRLSEPFFLWFFDSRSVCSVAAGHALLSIENRRLLL